MVAVLLALPGAVWLGAQDPSSGPTFSGDYTGRRHSPLTQITPLTLEAIAEFPLITYQEGYTGRARIDAAFAEQGLIPDIVMSALDADVIKSYVELGLGIGIIAAMAYHPKRDAGLVLIENKGLFELNTTWIALRRGHYLRDFALRFIEYCSPSLTEERIRDSVFPKALGS